MVEIYLDIAFIIKKSLQILGMHLYKTKWLGFLFTMPA